MSTDWKREDMGIELSNPQCHPINGGTDIAIIGARKQKSIFIMKKGEGKPIRLMNGEYGLEPIGNTVISTGCDEKDLQTRIERVIKAWMYPKRVIDDIMGLFHLFHGTFKSEFISFGGRKPHLDRITLYTGTNEVIREDIYSSIQDQLPVFGMAPRGIYVNECGWSHLIATGGRCNGHDKSITMIHFPSHKVTHFKNLLPSQFGYHAMIPLSSFLSSNTLGFMLIRDKTTLQCIYKKDENEWDFKKFQKPSMVKGIFGSAGWVLIQDKWIIGVGGAVDRKSSKLIRIFNIPRNEWSVSPIELTKGLYAMGTCIIGNDLHVIGGRDESEKAQSTHFSIPLSRIIPSLSQEAMIEID